VVYSVHELNYMQAAQFVGLGGKSDEFAWARSPPRGPATPDDTIVANGRQYHAEELPIDLQDPQYRKYVQQSLLAADLAVQTQQQTLYPTIGQRLEGFQSDSDSDTQEVYVTKVQPVRVSRRVVGFQSDSDTEESEEPVQVAQQTQRVSLDEDIRPSRLTPVDAKPPPVLDDDEYYSYTDDDELEIPVATPAVVSKGKQEVEEVSPFDDKFATSSGSDDDDELSERVLQAVDATQKLRSRWNAVTSKELPTLDVRRASVQDVRQFVAQLSAHSAEARKTSMELARDVHSTLTDLSALSEDLS
jgi:hypothetical protein